jgi:hypothetical protein
VSVLDAFFILALGTGLIAMLFGATGATLPKVISVIAIVLGLVAAASSTSIARFQVQRFFESRSHGATVSINGQRVENADEIVTALQSLSDLPAHHSHPVKTMTVEISDRTRLLLWLGRDSDNPREYWVYYPKHLITRNNEVGRIITPLFDAY